MGAWQMTAKLQASVSFNPTLGCYVSEASPRLPRSLAAPDLALLKRKIVICFLGRRGKLDRPVAVHLSLDPTARAQQACAGSKISQPA
jgi:hypothetical protein